MGKQLATDIVENVHPFAVHLGLPCGTCSRARELPVAQKLLAQGAPQPPPLRDADHLFGLDNSRQSDQVRAQLANEIYRTAVAILESCFKVNAFVILENPTRSWLWAILVALVKQSQNQAFKDWYFQMHNVDFSACMHGGCRPKSTRLRTSCKQLLQLQKQCHNNHVHKQWTITLGADSWNFSTATEAEDPALLLKRIVTILAALAPSKALTYTAKFFRLNSLLLMGKQTTAHHQLIPEFKTSNLSLTRLWVRALKILDRPAGRGVGEVEACVSTDNSGNMDGVDSIDMVDNTEVGLDINTLNSYRVGWYYSPKEHVDIATKLEHPCESDAAVPDDLKIALFNILTKGLHEVAKERAEILKGMINRANDLRVEEARFKKTLDPEVADVVKHKRLLLFRWLLDEIAFEDPVVIDHMEKGVKLVGWEDDSLLYSKRCAAPTITETQLNSDAVWRRKALRGRA